MFSRRWLRWTLYLLGWTLLGLFFATQNFINSYVTIEYARRLKRAPSFAETLALALSEWYIWAALAPLLIWLARRFPIERPARLRRLVVHVLVGIVLSAGKVLVDPLAAQLIGFNPNLALPTFKLHPNLVTYWAIVGASHLLDYYRRYRERELRLAQAQLQVLKMQLQPHFLFNTLHAISALMHRNVEAADRMMARLSDLLRLTIESAGVEEVALKQEMEFLDRYLEIQKTRFSDRLTVTIDIDPETLDARVPNLILQPLVENAIRHGIASRAEPGKVEIRARRLKGNLQIEVRDDGPGLPPGEPREGVGLSNTRARLRQLYGDRQRLQLSNAPGGGLLAALTIPFSS